MRLFHLSSSLVNFILISASALSARPPHPSRFQLVGSAWSDSPYQHIFRYDAASSQSFDAPLVDFVGSSTGLLHQQLQKDATMILLSHPSGPALKRWDRRCTWGGCVLAQENWEVTWTAPSSTSSESQLAVETSSSKMMLKWDALLSVLEYAGRQDEQDSRAVLFEKVKKVRRMWSKTVKMRLEPAARSGLTWWDNLAFVASRWSGSARQTAFLSQASFSSSQERETPEATPPSPVPTRRLLPRRTVTRFVRAWAFALEYLAPDLAPPHRLWAGLDDFHDLTRNEGQRQVELYRRGFRVTCGGCVFSGELGGREVGRVARLTWSSAGVENLVDWEVVIERFDTTSSSHTRSRSEELVGLESPRETEDQKSEMDVAEADEEHNEGVRDDRVWTHPEFRIVAL